jgi:diacylglycerol O-acyltransferase / wax synthase
VRWLIFWALRKLIYPGLYLAPIDSIIFGPDKDLLATIHGVLKLDSVVNIREIKQCFEERIKTLNLHRLTQKAVWRPVLWHYWETDEEFSVNNHIFYESLPEPAGQTQLEEFVSACLRRSLNDQRPLWEHIVIDNFKDESGKRKTVIVIRLHHCLGDGIGLMRTTLAILKRQGSSSVVVSSLPSSSSSPTSSASSSSSTSKSTSVSAAVTSAPSRGKRAHKSSRSCTGSLTSALSSTKKMVFMRDDPVSVWKAPDPITCKTPVLASWTVASLDRLKRCSKDLGLSINDILLAAAAGGLRKFNNTSRSAASPLAVAWVSMRGTSLVGEPVFGNEIGAIYFSIPIDVETPLARFDTVQKQTQELLVSWEPLISYVLMSVFGLLPAFIHRPVWHLLAFKTTFSLSNLPGPTSALDYIDAKVEQILFFVPPQQTIGHFITIMSYNGTIGFGLATDSRLIQDPKKVVNFMNEEMDDLIDALYTRDRVNKY